MRLPCVLILFASATRPVGVGAHVEPSDVVTSDGRFEVQRHLRVQEGAHGDDVDERTNSFNFGEEVISSAEKLEPTTSNSIPRDSAPDTFKRLAESLLEGPSDSTIKSLLIVESDGPSRRLSARRLKVSGALSRGIEFEVVGSSFSAELMTSSPKLKLFVLSSTSSPCAPSWTLKCLWTSNRPSEVTTSDGST
ncbi:hypothetical protein DD238_003028 [Peronospora effusa]|uniref:RxLR effector candidate protein n=1 Tax=Peronospora effusa TaxID=542832 RepID=A0A3M6VIB5_9STRA|nr:hypothetical protein DD238_003028 [Peronospora effusa]